jgi:NAD+ synthase
MIDLRFSEAELAERRENIVGFVRERVDESGTEGAVIGLSGGVDSSVTAALATEALGPEDVYGLVLPGTVSRDDNMSDAERMATRLEIPYDVIEIEPIVERFLDAYPEARGDEVAVGNARARVRAVLGYLVSNHENRLVLGTGNRSEALAGYFTKYGDQAVDCNPIGTLYKTQVRQMARAVGVPDGIVSKPPTAGLWEGQTDEDEMGVSYETLDAVLALHVDGPLSRTATRRLVDADEDTIDRVIELYESSAHKRRMPPAPDPV